ncbi:MAG: hypothetical protein IB618_01945 [Candidatus Pacearchaeota archaeon]|nr:MAG: hypothetical protein IB618_01945 [Candidatus Pacearchaeota archaeon]
MEKEYDNGRTRGNKIRDLVKENLGLEILVKRNMDEEMIITNPSFHVGASAITAIELAKAFEEAYKGDSISAAVEFSSALHKGGVPAIAAIEFAKEKGKILVPNILADYIITEPSQWISVAKDCCICNASPFWTGTMTAYREPDKRLGSAIEYEDTKSKIKWIFPIPAEFRKMKNTILAVEYPHYKLKVWRDQYEDNRITVLTERNKIIPVENFPKKEGWYNFDKNTGIPISVGGTLFKGRRYLDRRGKRVGPLARYGFDSHTFGPGKETIDAQCRPSVCKGVLVISHEAYYKLEGKK